MLGPPQSVDFKLIWHHCSMKRGSPRIVLPSLIILTHAHAIFTTGHPSYPCIWSGISHVTLDRHCFVLGLESPPTRLRNETPGTAVARLASYTILGLALAPGSIQRSLWPRLG